MYSVAKSREYAQDESVYVVHSGRVLRSSRSDREPVPAGSKLSVLRLEFISGVHQVEGAEWRSGHSGRVLRSVFRDSIHREALPGGSRTRGGAHVTLCEYCDQFMTNTSQGSA